MKKQTKLVAVLSTAALLAIGASMTSFAATGWAEEDGTWVYYDRNGEKVTDKWAKSGNNWYYLDESGEMAVDTLIEDGDNYYYVDVNGVMAANQWVAIDNEDAGEDDEPEAYWYYFQANGKAMKNTTNQVALKTINGKKYTFDDEGKMLYGWVSEDNEHYDNTDSDAFANAGVLYYFGDENDGAMTTGWALLDVTYDVVEDNTYNAIAPVFTDDEDQSRWFYFQSNGKKVHSDSADKVKEKTINGKKYGFDQYGAMVAEWSVDVDRASKNGVDILGSKSDVIANNKGVSAKYAQQWRYFNSVEDGSKVSRGWFKVVSAEYLNDEKYEDDETDWYYAKGNGDLYAGVFKTINGKKYAFRNDGRMINGLKFIKSSTTEDNLSVLADDNSSMPFDTEDAFLENAPKLDAKGYKCYYFGGSDDGAMRTNKTNITIDGDNYTFFFEKSGSKKGAGTTGIQDKKYYQSGMLLSAGSDEKYQVVKTVKNGSSTTYTKLDDATKFLEEMQKNAATTKYADVLTGKAEDATITIGSVKKKAKDLKEAYVFTAGDDYHVVNTAGKVMEKSKSKDGNDYVYVTNSNGNIVGIYVED